MLSPQSQPSRPITDKQSSMGDVPYIKDLWYRLQQSHRQLQPDPPTLPPPGNIEGISFTLPNPQSPSYLAGKSDDEVVEHINSHIVPALCGQAKASRYYGFVTGGILPIAEWADNVVSHMDQNVQVHLPKQTVATIVEDAALNMVLGVLHLHDGEWNGRTFTTGATASNILGLACGREAILAKRLDNKATVGDVGLLQACKLSGVTEIQVLTSAAHSSLSKAASVIGLGRLSVKELGVSEHEPWKLDLVAVERELKTPGTASIIAVSVGEVNTGRYALHNIDEWKKLRQLADTHNAWIHVDGAFGIFGRALDESAAFRVLHSRTAGIHMADSITVDGHKILNVPYDCGMFFTRDSSVLQSVFTNPNAAYLSSTALSGIPSPLNIGIENSRRFRALPVYAALLSEGRPGIGAMLSRMVQLSRKIATFLRDSPHYYLLPDEITEINEIFVIVLFRAKDKKLNEVLVDKINQTRQMYVGGTTWRGVKAVRIAISNWKVDVERDYKIIVAILSAVAEGQEFDIRRYQEEK